MKSARLSQFPLYTTKETPAEAVLTSHKLMLRSGLVNKVSSGLYTFLPCGLKILQKITNIVRQEMDAIGGLELLMPIVQPSEMWEKNWEDRKI